MRRSKKKILKTEIKKSATPPGNIFHYIKIFLKSFWGGSVTTIGLCAAIYPLWPHVAIEMNGTFDPLQSPYWATATVTNNGFIPLENVTVGARFGPFNYIPIDKSFSEAETILDPDTIDEKPFSGPGFGYANWATGEMVMDQKFSVRMTPPLEVKSFLIYPSKKVVEKKPGFVKLFRLHMSIVVDYNLWFLPFRFEKQQMFRTVRSQNCNNCLDWLYQ